MLADVCKRSQQVTTCCVFRWEYKGLWDTNTHNSIHTPLWCACATLLDVLCKRTQHYWTTLRWPQNNRNVGTSWLWSLTSFKFHPTTFNKSQQHATTHNMVCKRSQHVGLNNVASCWPRMLREFARSLTHDTLLDTAQWFDTSLQSHNSKKLKKKNILALNRRENRNNPVW